MGSKSFEKRLAPAAEFITRRPVPRVRVCWGPLHLPNPRRTEAVSLRRALWSGAVRARAAGIVLMRLWRRRWSPFTTRALRWGIGRPQTDRERSIVRRFVYLRCCQKDDSYTGRVRVSAQAGRRRQLLSKFIDILKWYMSLPILAPPGDTHPSARGIMRIVSTQEIMEVRETSHYREIAGTWENRRLMHRPPHRPWSAISHRLVWDLPKWNGAITVWWVASRPIDWDEHVNPGLRES